MVLNTHMFNVKCYIFFLMRRLFYFWAHFLISQNISHHQIPISPPLSLLQRLFYISSYIIFLGKRANLHNYRRPRTFAQVLRRLYWTPFLIILGTLRGVLASETSLLWKTMTKRRLSENSGITTVKPVYVSRGIALLCHY